MPEDIDEDDDGQLPRRHYVDGAWGRTANPNTADGELQNMAAFGSGLANLSRPKRLAAKGVVWLILLAAAMTVIAGIIGIVHTW